MVKAMASGGLAEKRTDWKKVREEWRGIVEGLVADIERWSLEQGWVISKSMKTLTEPHLGQYSVPDLLIRLPEGRISVDVVGRDIVGADGRVDLTAFPSQNHVLLIRVGGKWKVLTDSLATLRRAWGRTAFLDIARQLALS